MIGTSGAVVGRPISFTGYAGDFDKAVRAMQFSLDAGTTWTTYEMPRTTPERNVCWTFSYTPDHPGRYRLLIRSVNEDGQASPEPACVEFVAVEAPEEPGAVRVGRYDGLPADVRRRGVA